MTEYVFWNWVFCLVTTFLLLFAVWRNRFLLIKPSMMIVLLFHLTVQWIATVQSAQIETYLPDPWAFALLVHGFPLIGFGVSALVGRAQTWAV